MMIAAHGTPTLRGLQVMHINGGSASGRSRSALAHLLTEGELAGAKSAIVYVSYQAQADDTASFLRSQGVVARSYHAGGGGEQGLAMTSGAQCVVISDVATQCMPLFVC